MRGGARSEKGGSLARRTRARRIRNRNVRAGRVTHAAETNTAKRDARRHEGRTRAPGHSGNVRYSCAHARPRAGRRRSKMPQERRACLFRTLPKRQKRKKIARGIKEGIRMRAGHTHQVAHLVAHRRQNVTVGAAKQPGIARKRCCRRRENVT